MDLRRSKKVLKYRKKFIDKYFQDLIIPGTNKLSKTVLEISKELNFQYASVLYHLKRCNLKPKKRIDYEKKKNNEYNKIYLCRCGRVKEYKHRECNKCKMEKTFKFSHAEKIQIYKRSNIMSGYNK
jgi:hypothetical protein